VAIVGYMGSGKSSVGRIVARRLGWDFVDLDRLVEREAERTIPEIFSESGERHFRDLEHRILMTALDGPADRVVACGGGTVVRPENRARLAQIPTVFLEEDVKVLYGRTRAPDRPLRGAGYEDFERRYRERLPLYREVAALELPAKGRTKHQVAEEVLRWLNG
jgi:shikimate kinase